MAVSELIYDNWGNVTEADLLYDDIPVTYTLETSAGTVEIDEPMGWAKVPFVHKRSPDRHGFIYESTGPDFKLQFPCESGKEEIIAEYLANGNDGECIFTKILQYEGGIIEFQGVLNLSSMEREEDIVSCVCERKSLHQKLGSRLSTKIDLASSKNLDGEDITANLPFRILLTTGQEISERFKSEKIISSTATYTDTRVNAAASNMFFTVSDPKINTLLQDFYPSILGVSGDPASYRNDTHTLFRFRSAGSYEVNVQVDFQVQIRTNPAFLQGGTVNNAFIQTKMIRLKAPIYQVGPESDWIIEHIIDTMPAFDPNRQGFVYPRVQATHTFNMDVLEDETLVLYAIVVYQKNYRVKSTSFVVTENLTKVEITGSSTAEPSLVAGYLIKEAMEYALKRIVGLEDVLRTNFYSQAGGEQPTDGCGALRFITNGGRVRGTSSFPTTFTWSDLLASIDAIDGIGVGYEWDSENQKEVLRIEQIENFYRDMEIIELDPDLCYDYKEYTAKELIYNKYVFGYEKFKEEEDYGRDEIHAYMELQSPVKKESNEYEKKSKFIGSGYVWEETRRVQFLDNDQATTSYDDDIFIMHVLGVGDDFVYSPINEEPFDDVSGIISPETTANMTLTPKRMLLAHSKWLMSSLIYKDSSEEIITTLAKQNRDFSSTLKADYCERGDSSHLPLKNSEPVLLDSFAEFKGIYSPEWVELKCRLSMFQVRMIMNAHRNLDPDGKNYGYITFTDDMGEKRKGWLYEMSFDRESEAMSMKLLKKKFPL